jgi:hypothetical protein
MRTPKRGVDISACIHKGPDKLPVLSVTGDFQCCLAIYK